MSNFSKNNSLNLLSQIFSSSVSLDRQSSKGNIEDDWEYIEFLDLKLSSVSGDEDDDASVNGVDSVMGDQENSYKMTYTILSKADMLGLLEDKITKVSTVLLLPKDEAAILLQYFKWCVDRTIDEWVACEEKVRDAVGLFVRPVAEIPIDATEITCRICHTDFPRKLIFSVSCGHQICSYCWKDYIREAVNDGPTLRCPETCEAAVGLYLIELLAYEGDKIKFENLLLSSYLACCREAKWCPAPDCNYAVFSSSGGEGTVTCRCLHSFCWSCSREAHAPVDCGTVTEWMSETPFQSENWVMANAVTCPNCKFQYEKELYFRNIFCTVCGHEFCSGCGDDWSNGKHVSEGLWSSSCHLNGDNTTEFLKKSLERYNHHYEGWITCETSRENAVSDLKVFQGLQLDPLCTIFDLSSTDLNFLVEALGQVVACWQILKWTYVYGYYLPADKQAKNQLLEFMQEQATGLVIRLHEHIQELQNFLHEDVFFVQFTDFQIRITTLTRVIRNYFHQLEVSLVAGLPEVTRVPKFTPQLKMSQERWESSCSQISPNASLSSKVIKVEDNMDISSPVGSTV